MGCLLPEFCLGLAAGTVKRGVITPNTPLLLGPDIGDGSFKAASIKSIHYKVSTRANLVLACSSSGRHHACRQFALPC
jgi:GTPase